MRRARRPRPASVIPGGRVGIYERSSSWLALSVRQIRATPTKERAYRSRPLCVGLNYAQFSALAAQSSYAAGNPLA